MQPDDNATPLSDLAAKAGGFLGGLGRRALITLCCLIGASIAGATFTQEAGLPAPSSFWLFLSAFIGLVALIPARLPRSPDEALPPACGAALCFFWSLVGMPWQFTLIWGGCAAFACLALLRKGNLGLSWSALPALLIGLYGYFSGLASGTSKGAPLWTFVLPLLAAWGAQRLRALRHARRPRPAGAPDPALAVFCDEYAASAHLLREKTAQLPPGPRPRVHGIADGAEKILHCMASDPADIAGGKRFLARYLKAAHNVVDDYIRLMPEADRQNEAAATLAQAERALAGLEKAFADEHSALLRNDAANLEAELKVLDTLLKMDGKPPARL